ncbi:MAG: diacylglycerol kinase family protein [Lentimicrobium sp.]|jgi:diacylglycerol kinase (ATP)|nr:diacylglycerol kinase family protein [Lentimicrobium sp.]
MNSVNPSFGKFFESFIPAIKGLVSAFKSEQNLRFHFILIVCVIFLGIVTNITLLEWLVIIVFFAIVISMELINTAIEKLSDFVQPERDNRIKIIKDISASAVFWAALMAFFAGLLIFIPKISIIVNKFQ